MLVQAFGLEGNQAVGLARADQRAGKLMQEDAGNARWFSRRQGVMSIVLQAGGRFRMTQAIRSAVQSGKYLLGRPGMGCRQGI